MNMLFIWKNKIVFNSTEPAFYDHLFKAYRLPGIIVKIPANYSFLRVGDRIQPRTDECIAYVQCCPNDIMKEIV